MSSIGVLIILNVYLSNFLFNASPFGYEDKMKCEKIINQLKKTSQAMSLLVWTLNTQITIIFLTFGVSTGLVDMATPSSTPVGV